MNIFKKGICAAFAFALFAGPVFSAEKTLQTTDRVPAMKAFFSRFIKPKAQKKQERAESPISDFSNPLLLSLDDCVAYALKHDPNIKNAKDTQKIQKALIGEAKSNYFPTLLGSTGYNINNIKYFGDMNNFVIGSGSYGGGGESSINNNYYGLNMSVNQLIWDFGYTSAKINMNKYNWEASGYDVENTVLNTVYNVKIAYAAVLAARANEDIFARSVRINELNVERTKAMYEVGLKSKIDLVNAQVYLTDAKISLLKAQNQYQNALISLNNSMFYTNAPDYTIKDTETFNFQKNYSVKNEINVAYDRKNYDGSTLEAQIKDGAILTSGIEKQNILKSYTFKPFNLSLNDAINQAYSNRPDVKSIELVKKASDEALKAVKRSFLPDIGASAGYSYMRRSDYGSNSIGVFAGADLPSVNVMLIKTQIEQGKSYLDIAVNNVDLLRKNVYFQVQTYYVNMKQLERRIPLMSEKVAQTLENFELADGRYAVGLGNFLELQQAQTNYNNAQLAFVQSVFDYNQARYYLEKSMGIK